MKNLLNQDLVCSGASGEWVLPSGEWALGTGEWRLSPARLRWLRWRRRLRRLTRRLALDRESVTRAAWRGAGLGLALMLTEAILYMPIARMFEMSIPLRFITVTTAFNLLLGLTLSLVATPILGLRRGAVWHTLAILAVLVLLILTIRGSTIPEALYFSEMALVALLYLGGLGLARWRRVGGLGVFLLGLAATGGVWATPSFLAPVKQQLAERMVAVAPKDAPNVLLIVLDTLRADRLDLMGYDRETFPWLTALAQEGAVFDRAISAAPWTVPSHASMFTGLYPSQHGAHNENTYLAASRTTLAEVLHGHGWETVVISSNPWLSQSSGLTQGFDVERIPWIEQMGTGISLSYRFAWNLGLVDYDMSARHTTENWLEWLEDWDGNQPFFAFLNYWEPHFPYHQLPQKYLTTFSPPDTPKDELIRSSKAVTMAERRGRRVDQKTREQVSDLYDAAIRYQGEQVRRAIQALDQRHLLNETIVVLVADHGDLLGEHGGLFQHKRSLLDHLLRVPLVIRYPSRVPEGRRISTPVTTAALMPTILDLAGLSVPDTVVTHSFAGLLEGRAAIPSPLFSENYEDHKGADFHPRSDFDRTGVRYRSLEEDGWKLIVDSTGKRWLFRPMEDPEESHDLSIEHPEVVERLTGLLGDLILDYDLDAEATSEEPPPDLDPLVRKTLRSFGYLDG